MNASAIPWMPAWVPDWALFVAAGLLLLGAVAIFWRTLRANLGRPVRSCPKCWYDMSRTTGLLCPECGTAAKSERALAHRRFRPGRWALVVSGLLLASVVVALLPHARKHGWLSLAPTTVLVWLVPFEDRVERQFSWAIISRFSGAVTPGVFFDAPPDPEAAAAVLGRAVRGIPFLRPPGANWASRYGELIVGMSQYAMYHPLDGSWQLRGGLTGVNTPAGRTGVAARGGKCPALDSVMQEVLDLPFIASDIETREVWPAGREVLIEATLEHVTPSPCRMEQQISYSINGGPWCQPYPFRDRTTTGFVPDADSPNPSTIEVNVELTRVDGANNQRTMLRSLNRTLQFGIAPAVGDVLTPVTDPPLDVMLGKAVVVSPKWAWNPEALLQVAAGTRYDGVAIAARVELLKDGEPVYAELIRGTIGRPLQSASFVRSPASEGLTGRSSVLDSSKAMQRASTEPGVWTVRVTPVPEAAAEVLRATRYWSGTLELPVNPKR